MTEETKVDVVDENLQLEEEAKELAREVKQEELGKDLKSSRIEKELQQGYREVKVEGYGLLRLHKPTVEENYDANILFTEEYSRLMSETNLKTAEEQENIVKERVGIDREQIEDTMKSLAELTAEIVKAKKRVIDNKRSRKAKTELDTLTRKYKSLYEEFLKLNATYQKYMAMTLESKAEEFKLVYLMSRCIRTAEGERVWNSVSELRAEKDQEPVGSLVKEFVTFNQGVDPAALQSVPDLLASIGDVD